MKQLTAGGELTFSCPEGFHEMTQEELEAGFSNQYRNRIGIRDEEKHVMIVVQWNRVNVLLAALTDPKSTLRGTEFKLRRLLKEYGYRQTEKFTRTVAGQNVRAIRYEYRIDGNLLEGEVYILKKKTFVFTIYTYAGKPVTNQARRAIDEVLDSIRL